MHELSFLRKAVFAKKKWTLMNHSKKISFFLSNQNDFILVMKQQGQMK